MAKKTKNKEKNKKKKQGTKRTEKKKITIPDFNLTSSWKCKDMQVSNNSWVIETGPTTSSTKQKFKWSIPSGGKVKKAEIWATLNNPKSGISVLTVNGNKFSKTSGKKRGVSVTLSGTGGSFEAEFKFKANGAVSQDVNTHSGTLMFKDVYLYIEYTYSGNAEPEPDKARKFEVPPQCACIYDQKTGGVYLFDGVLKIQHSLSVKYEEEPEKKKEEYINNARNEPDKVVIDVRMSDVYTNGKSTADATKLNDAQTKAFKAAKKALIDSRKARSTTVYQTMHWLKEERRKLTLITTHFIYVDMIITALTVNQDETSPYGWEGQITFQSAFKTKEQQQNHSSGKPNDIQPPSPSMASGIIRW